jgi:fructose-1-phosphate kinase PfkB-like protein
VIVILSLNTSRDVMIQVPSWEPGAVERAERQVIIPGGKAVNVARVCGWMGTRVRLVALADAELADQIRDLSPLVETHLVVSSAPSRTDVCLTTGSGVTTVVNGPTPKSRPVDVAAAMKLLDEAIEPEDVLVLAGRQQPDTLLPLISMAAKREARLFVDMSGEDLSIGLAAAPAIAKINAAELAASSTNSSPALAWLNGRAMAPQPRELVVTRGEHGLRAWLADGRVAEVRPPRIRLVNDFAAGDAMTAGILSATAEGRPLPDGLVRGSAWAAASVERLGLDFEPDRARALEGEISVEFVSEASSAAGSAVAAGTD